MTDQAQCPGCETAMIAQRDGKTLVVDFCAGCGGLWLDKGELEAEGARLPDDLPRVTAAKPRTCPRCVKPLDTVKGREVELDLCPGCGGVFLDRGELTTLIERTKQADAGAELERDAKDVAADVGSFALGALLEGLLSLL